jgi:catechol-2,3-dioxygenase
MGATFAKVPPRRVGFAPKEYAHVVFRTAQTDTMIDWYCKVLGMQVVMRNPVINFLTWDDSQDRLAILTDPGATPRTAGSAGLDHVAFSLASLRDLTENYRRLKAENILPYRCMNHGVATSMYYRDPDGNQIELTVANFDDVETMNAWLARGDFDENPIGVPLNADELLAQVESGTPDHELRRPHAEHRDWLRNNNGRR